MLLIFLSDHEEPASQRFNIPRGINGTLWYAERGLIPCNQMVTWRDNTPISKDPMRLQESLDDAANAQRVSLVASGNVDPVTMNPSCWVQDCIRCDGTGHIDHELD
jgi:hypothetical protein